MANERVIAYTRVSSAQQATDEKTSHDYQEERIRLACEARGYKVVEVLQEVDKRWELDRPQLTKARQMMKNGEADVLMAMVMDRFSADTKHLYLILDDVEKAGGRLEFADQTYDDTPQGRFLRNVSTFMAELEIFRISARARQGHVGAALAGAPVGRPPHGYKIEGKGKSRHLVVDETERSTVRRIFRDVADGIPVREIARSLEEEGQKTSIGGATWSTAAIRYIIHNAVYKGIWRGQKTRTSLEKVKGKTKSVTVKRPEEEQGPIFPCPWIVDADLWEAANARLKLNAAQSARNNRYPELHLVRPPFGVCGECGHPLHCVPPSGQSRKPRYRCGNIAKGSCVRPSAKQDEMDAVVWERIDMTVNNPGAALKKLIDQAHDGTLDSRIAELEGDIEKRAGQLERLLNGITRAYTDGDDELAEGMKNRRKPMAKVQEEAQTELAALEEQVRRRKAFESLPAKLEQMLHEDYDQFESLTHQQKQNLMAKLNLRVLLYADKPDLGLKPGWVSSDMPKKPVGVEDRIRIIMTRLPEHLFGWSDEDGFWDFDPEYLVETAVGILQPVEPSDEAKQRMAEPQAKLTPEQLQAHNAYLASLENASHGELYLGDEDEDEDESRIGENSPAYVPVSFPRSVTCQSNPAYVHAGSERNHSTQHAGRAVTSLQQVLLAQGAWGRRRKALRCHQIQQFVSE